MFLDKIKRRLVRGVPEASQRQPKTRNMEEVNNPRFKILRLKPLKTQFILDSEKKIPTIRVHDGCNINQFIKELEHMDYKAKKWEDMVKSCKIK